MYTIQAGKTALPFRADGICFDTTPKDLPHPNTMIFRLRCGENILVEKEYYSVGGGFIVCKGETEPPPPIPPVPYANMRQLRSQMNRQNLGLVELLWRNETVLSGLDATQLKAGLAICSIHY